MREAAVHLRQDVWQEQLEHGQRAVRVEVEALHDRIQHNSDQLHRLTTTLQEMQLKLMRQIQQETSEVRYVANEDTKSRACQRKCQCFK